MPILLAESRCGIGIQWIEEEDEWMESGKQAKRKEKQKVKRRPQIFPKSKKYMWYDTDKSTETWRWLPVTPAGTDTKEEMGTQAAFSDTK